MSYCMPVRAKKLRIVLNELLECFMYTVNQVSLTGCGNGNFLRQKICFLSCPSLANIIFISHFFFIIHLTYLIFTETFVPFKLIFDTNNEKGIENLWSIGILNQLIFYDFLRSLKTVERIFSSVSQFQYRISMKIIWNIWLAVSQNI